MLKFYLVPIEQVGNYRGPEYFKWRFDQTPETSIDCKWSMMDYGFLPNALVLAHDITLEDHTALILNSDVYPFPDDLDQPVDDPGVDTFFEAIHIPTDWLTPATTWRELLRQLAGMFQFNQRYGGVSADLSGTPHSVFENVTLDDTYSDFTTDETIWFDATVESFGYDPSIILPNQKLRQLVKTAGNFWEGQPFYMGGYKF